MQRQRTAGQFRCKVQIGGGKRGARTACIQKASLAVAEYVPDATGRLQRLVHGESHGVGPLLEFPANEMPKWISADAAYNRDRHSQPAQNGPSIWRCTTQVEADLVD